MRNERGERELSPLQVFGIVVITILAVLIEKLKALYELNEEYE